jgi:hypothetical protein
MPEPAVTLKVDLSRLNWFVSTGRFFATRRARLSSVIDALHTLAAGESLAQKVIATRYTEGLPLVGADRRERLLHFLLGFAITAGCCR